MSHSLCRFFSLIAILVGGSTSNAAVDSGNPDVLKFDFTAQVTQPSSQSSLEIGDLFGFTLSYNKTLMAASPGAFISPTDFSENSVGGTLEPGLIFSSDQEIDFLTVNSAPGGEDLFQASWVGSVPALGGNRSGFLVLQDISGNGIDGTYIPQSLDLSFFTDEPGDRAEIVVDLGGQLVADIVAFGLPVPEPASFALLAIAAAAGCTIRRRS